MQSQIDITMRVLLINGSPHKQGNTFLALQEIAKQLEKNGIESEMLHVGTKPVRGCIACGTCKTKGENRCTFDDDLCNQALTAMEQADALVIGSPVYYGQPNGTLTSLVQRMAYAGGALMQNKPAAAVAVCRRGGATAALQTMLMPFQIMNMPLVSSQYWNIVYGRTEGEAALDAEGMQTMRTLADNMAWMLQNQAPKPEREARQAMAFIR